MIIGLRPPFSDAAQTHPDPEKTDQCRAQFIPFVSIGVHSWLLTASFRLPTNSTHILTAMKNEINPPSRSGSKSVATPVHHRARRAALWAALVCAALAFMAQPARADVTEAWVHRYKKVMSGAYDRAFKVVLD